MPDRKPAGKPTSNGFLYVLDVFQFRNGSRSSMQNKHNSVAITDRS